MLENFDELVKKESFTDEFNADYISYKIETGKKTNWFQLPADKVVEVYTALEENGLLKRAKNKAQLIAISYKLGEIHGVMNTKYRNEAELELFNRWQKLNLQGQKIAFNLLTALLKNDDLLRVDINRRKNVIRLV